MNSEFFVNIIRFFILLLLQVSVFNNMELFGYINPYPYILFIVLYPVNNNRYLFLISCFLLGLSMDIFSNSGGVHAAACVTLGYLRHHLFKIAFGLSYEYQTIKIPYASLREQLIFVNLCVVVQHTILFFLEAFRFDLFGNAL